jgi:hypothetical protein
LVLKELPLVFTTSDPCGFAKSELLVRGGVNAGHQFQQRLEVAHAG